MPALRMKDPSPSNTAAEAKLEQLRPRAYELYEARNRENGNDLEDWFQAETDITGNTTTERFSLKLSGWVCFACLPTQEEGGHSMRDHKSKALILDSDPDTLITLQRTLENGGVDTTITWDDNEAQNLIRSTPFDVTLIGDHPPEIRAERTVREFRRHGALSPCLFLRTNARVESRKPLQQLGVVGVVPKRDPDKVLQVVQKVVS
jgi:CheY-like chemotaxis protein